MPVITTPHDIVKYIVRSLRAHHHIKPDEGWDRGLFSAIDELNQLLHREYKHRDLIEAQIDEFNDTLLKYAHHIYRSDFELTEEEDVLNSLAVSIQLLGEELNHSTITKGFLEDIFNSMTDMLIVVDAIGYINSVNSATAIILNYGKEELERENIRLLLPEHMSYRNFLVEATKKGSSTLTTKDGTQLPVSITISPFVRGDDQQIGNVIIARDISPMIKYQREIIEQNEIISKKNEELRLAIQKIEESEKLKTAFLQNVSHEIRTPLNSIIGLTHVINNEELQDSEKKEITDLIEKSGKRLVEIVNNILDISKIETGQYQLTNLFFSLNDVMKDQHHFFSKDALHKKLEFRYELGLPDEEDMIYTDRYVINQALTNLINNAIKFTEKGTVIFGYVRKCKVLEFYVQDTGIGIAPAYHSIIFNRFAQADSGLKRNHEGAGLGLSITKGIIELLGGTIWFESEPKKGTMFRFTIPYLSSAEHEGSNQDSENENNSPCLDAK